MKAMVKKKMSNLSDTSIEKRIAINKNHIDNFVLETNQGTKRVKDKFRKNAVSERNNYVEKESKVFNNYKIDIEKVMADRLLKLLPKCKNDVFENNTKKINNLFQLLIYNTDTSVEFKLGFNYIISSINNESSLDDLNNSIGFFIDKFKKVGIDLTIKDFKYSMFTEKYMNSYFKGDNLKEIFEDIYFLCPDIKIQIKLNLSSIVNQYRKELEKYFNVLFSKLLEDNNTNISDISDLYNKQMIENGQMYSRDEYTNVNMFLTNEKKISDYFVGSANRTKNYNMFAIGGDYDSLSDNDKKNYDLSTTGLYLTLKELKKYYKYEFLINDLIERYKNKDGAKNSYLSKQKEINKEDSSRGSLYKSYLKACGLTLFSKKNENKIKDSMLKMNEEIKKIYSLNQELIDLDINYRLSNLSNSASIYDLFMCSLSSFDYLERMFLSNENFEGSKIEDIINDFIKFLYNPNNLFLKDVNVFTDFDIVDIVGSKYRLLNLNVTNEMINNDNIDSTINSLSFINLIYNINNSSITIETINNICEMTKFTSII